MAAAIAANIIASIHSRSTDFFFFFFFALFCCFGIYPHKKQALLMVTNQKIYAILVNFSGFGALYLTKKLTFYNEFNIFTV